MSTSIGLLDEEVLETQSSAVRERVELGDRTLREHTSRGVIVNAAFQVGFAALGLLQRFAVAAFLTITEFGLWGIVLTIVMTLYWLKDVGIGDKFVQQDDPDQELAFQKAFTIELLYTLGFCALLLAVLPGFALLYDRWEILLPAAVLSLSLLLGALQSPLWISYRQMRFVRQRLLEAVNPVVATAVMIPLAVAGAGYWAIVAGILAGGAAGAVAAVATSPYRLALRFDRAAVREYVGFSWPLLASGIAGILVIQGTMLIGNYAVGLAGLGALALAASLITFNDRVDAVISRSIYPAVCAVKDRRELLLETFVKSNRLALMWGVPFGLGMFLFAPDLIRFVLGDRWLPAEGLLQAFGLIVAVRQVAFNWNLFMSATGNTRPLAVNGACLVAVFALVTAPAMIAWGLDGYIVGAAATLLVELAVRARYLRRLFGGDFRFLAHLGRAMAPSLPAVAAVAGLRALDSGGRSLGQALAELLAYLLVTAVATMLFERRLLAEIRGYLRGRREPTAGASTGLAAG